MQKLPSNCDVAVVGSGPAGASTARIAAAAGLHVVILEKSHIPRYKTCGGGILGRAARLLGEPTIPVTEQACCTAEFVLSPSLHFKVDRPDPIVFMTMRDTFDQWLISKAISAGASVCCNCVVEGIAIGADDVTLTTTRGQLRARYLVAADGAAGHTAKKAGWPDHRKLIPALEYEITVKDSDFARLNQSARFDFHAVPRGYAWVFPKKSHLSIGILTLHSTGVNLNQYLEKYLSFLNIAEPINIQRHGFVIPLSPRGKIFARNRVIITGDAAGFADPVTAEGITNAILSGQFAGHAIAAAFQDPQRVCETYDGSVHEHILPELRWAARLARLLYDTPRLRDALFKWQGQKLTEAMSDVVAGRLTYAQLLTDPTNYLKLIAQNSRSHRQNLRDSANSR